MWENDDAPFYLEEVEEEEIEYSEDNKEACKSSVLESIFSAFNIGFL